MKKQISKIKKYLTDDKRVFAPKLSLKKIFIIFIIGSIIGCYYEQILNLIKHFVSDGSFFWERRRGVIYTPLSPVYGAGAAIMTYVLLRKKKTDLNVFILGALIGGVFEYLISYFQETFVGTISWNYETYFLNIDGRTTIPFMIAWGFAALLFVRVIYPHISSFIEKIPFRLGNILFYIVLIVSVSDMIISWTAIIRQNLRRNNYPPFTFIGEFCDKHYNDETLKKYYPNMVIR